MALFCSVPRTSGQGTPAIQSGLTTDMYVNGFLLGEGVEAFNIAYSGGASQIGVLSGVEEAFSIGEGLVMSSDAAGTVAIRSLDPIVLRTATAMAR